MAYDIQLAARTREYLFKLSVHEVEEKKMFGGLTFMVNKKMCVSISGERLMCHFDPALFGELSDKLGFQKLAMNGKEYKGYCYVGPEGIQEENDFEYWVNLCLDFNQKKKARVM